MSPEDYGALDSMSRDELVARARALGATRPEVMTRVELRDEIIRLSEPDAAAQRRSRGWLGVARDLVASVVESGLNLREAAAAIRGDHRPEQEWIGPPPVATVTLAEIYVAQGHPDRALAILDEVLAREPDHPAANQLRDRLVNERTQKQDRKRARIGEAAQGIAAPGASGASAAEVEEEAPVAVRHPFQSEAASQERSEAAEGSLQPSVASPNPSFGSEGALASPASSTASEPSAESEEGANDGAPVEPSPETVHAARGASYQEASPEAPPAVSCPGAAASDNATAEPGAGQEQAAQSEGGRAQVASTPSEASAEAALAESSGAASESAAAAPAEPSPTPVSGLAAPLESEAPPASVPFEEEVPSAPLSERSAASSESPFSTMNPERTILDYAVEEPAVRRECVLVREGNKLYVHWDVRPLRGPFVLKLAVFIPKLPEPERLEREITLEHSAGGCPVEGLPPQAITRAVLGRFEGGSFVPLVVAAVLEGQVGATKRSVYRPPGEPPSVLEQELSTPTL